MAENITWKQNYLLTIAFDGTQYHGWQWQPDRPTVQQVIQDTLRRLYVGAPIILEGSSRTDAGVHANGFAASFKVPFLPLIPRHQLFGALNKLLPHDITITSLQPVPDNFHARFNARGKAYTYIINHGRRSPFCHRYAYFSYYRLDVPAITAAAHFLTGTHDFASFAVNNKQYENTVRTIFRIDVQEYGDFICITFIGNGFLYRMIRCLVGTLLAVGLHKLSPEAVKDILRAASREAAHNTVPPQGLFLMRVFYDDDTMHNFHLQSLPFLQSLRLPANR